MSWRLAAAAILCGLVAASCGEADRDCSDQATTALYEKRIAPLLADDRPKSCNECHLSGVDLTMFVRETPCQTMACMVQQGIVDLDSPKSSLVLAWIDRAKPASAGITAEVVAEERRGVLEWIEHTADCGTCYKGPNPCGGSAGETSCAIDESKTPELIDPGGCSSQALEKLFETTFFAYRGRCFPCHFEGQATTLPAPKWIATGPCSLAAIRTLRNVENAGYINASAPEQSKWLLKPLDEALGGIKHGGETKYHSKEETAYVRSLYFSQRWAECNQEAP